MTEPRIVPGCGPTPSPVCIVGEAPGVNEEIYGRPFVGASGEELTRMFRDAGLDRREMYATNVFKTRPPENQVRHFFVNAKHENACSSLPPSGRGERLDIRYEQEVRALIPELVGVGAKLVIALGGTALWALLGQQKISAYVGTVHPPTTERPFTVIPTFHPTAVLRNWGLRSTVVANLIKAKNLIGDLASDKAAPSNPEFQPKIKINPDFADVLCFTKRAEQAPLMAVDVETAHGQIRTISFTIASNEAFVIPFWEPPAASYWPTVAAEVAVWNCVRKILHSPGTKIFHNGSYDIQYQLRVHGISLRGRVEDTMLAHHALEPELPKSLGSLAATYLKLPEWKTMRLKSEKEEE